MPSQDDLQILTNPWHLPSVDDGMKYPCTRLHGLHALHGAWKMGNLPFGKTAGILLGYRWVLFCGVYKNIHSLSWNMFLFTRLTFRKPRKNTLFKKRDFWSSVSFDAPPFRMLVERVHRLVQLVSRLRVDDGTRVSSCHQTHFRNNMINSTLLESMGGVCFKAFWSKFP